VQHWQKVLMILNERKMFAVTDIFSSMRPLYYVSKLFGLTPYSYVKSSDSSYVIKEPSGPFVIWTLVITVFVLAGYLYNLFYFFYQNEYRTASSSIVIIFEKTWLFAFSVSILLLGLTRNRRKIHDIFRHMLEIKQNVLKNKARNTYVKIFYSLSLQVAFVAGFHICMLYSYATIRNSREEFACQFSYIIASFINTTGVLQFLFSLKILRWICRSIDDELERAEVSYFARNKVIAVRHIREQKSDSEQQSDKLYQLRLLHFKLYELVGLINACYGFLMLIETTHNFVMVVSLMHEILMALEQENGTNLVTHDVCLLLFYSAKVTMVLRTSQLTHDESKAMLLTVHKLLLCPNVSSACETQLRLFATQIVDNEIEFTACGIFPLDLSTLHSIIAAAATYIIILYQLKHA
jgi:gustatory receptor